MNYLQFVNTILETSKSHKLVYEVGEGDIYEHLNSGDHKYPCVFLTVQNVDSNGTQMTVTGSLFYVDALLSDTSNKLQIQSTGMTTLQQIFMRLMDNYPDFDLRTGRYTPFDEKFSDLCAGVFSNFTISFMDDTCIFNDDIFEGDEPITPEPEGKYLTITVDSNVGETIIHPNVTGSIPNLNLQYRINNGKWTDFIVGTTADIKVVAGDFVQWKGNNPDGVSASNYDYLNFSISDLCHLSGNVMSLIDGIGETTVIPDYYCFFSLFKGSSIKTVSSDFLPATTLKTSCYENMFNSCTELTKSPELPSTDLQEHCYLGMFNGCTSLTTAPKLPATVMALGCYNSMFKGCTSLTIAPELPATQLYIGCYSEMFMGCTSLVTAPELPAITLESQCYFYMFKNCTSLNYVKCLAVEGFSPNSMTLTDWLSGVAPTGTFVKKYGVEYLINSPSGIPEGWTVEEIDVPIPPEPTGKYMTITVDDAAGETVISPKVTGSLPNLNLQYRINNGEWIDFIVGTTADIHVVSGDVVQFKGNNPDGVSTDESKYIKFAISGNPVHLSGNIMSLIDGVGDTLVIPTKRWCFCRIFKESNIKTVSKDFLPATTLAEYCYYGMFESCQNLTQAPELPATTLVSGCYCKMFMYCSNLAQAPELPATTLADSCYDTMFTSCKLTQAPELPATTLASNCYKYMFAYSGITQAPELPATNLAYMCYNQMFHGCNHLTQSPELPAITLAEECYSSMFWDCVNLVKAPVLPATTLANNCYRSMFSGCTALTTAPELPATTLSDYCYSSMFKNCNNLNYVKCLATDITATNALSDWLSGVAATGTFVKKYGAEFLTNSPSGIPEGWTIEEIDAPIPPTPPEPTGKYMTITVDDAAGETVIKPKIEGSLPNLNLQYRINNGSWNDFIFGTTADIHAVAGDFVQFKGNNPDGISIDTNNYLNFSISDLCHLSGNVMSLIDGVGETKVIPNDYCFEKLFAFSNIKTVTKDFLPATNLKNYCYSSIFLYCGSLINSPALPATTLKEGCYYSMFYFCTELTEAPVLIAGILERKCYQTMFVQCNKINYIKSLATEITATNAMWSWLSGVATTGTFVKPAGVVYEKGTIPEGWTVEEI